MVVQALISYFCTYIFNTMKSYYHIFTLLLLSSTTCVSQNWNLIWEDEFNGNSLDSSKWIHDIGTGSQYGLYGWGNSELQYYHQFQQVRRKVFSNFSFNFNSSFSRGINKFCFRKNF